MLSPVKYMYLIPNAIPPESKKPRNDYHAKTTHSCVPTIDYCHVSLLHLPLCPSHQPIFIIHSFPITRLPEVPGEPPARHVTARSLVLDRVGVNLVYMGLNDRLWVLSKLFQQRLQPTNVVLSVGVLCICKTSFDWLNICKMVVDRLNICKMVVDRLDICTTINYRLNICKLIVGKLNICKLIYFIDQPFER